MFKTFSILFTVKYTLYLNTKVSHTHIYPTKKNYSMIAMWLSIRLIRTNGPGFDS